MTRITLQTRGGLGNQLFQYNMAHLLSNQLQSPDSKIVLRPDFSANRERTFQLSDLISRCRHSVCVRKIHRYLGPELRLGRLNEIRLKIDSYLKSTFVSLPETQSRPFEVLDPYINYLLTGFYQSFDLVNEVLDTYEFELIAQINCQLSELTPVLREMTQSPYVALHSRRTDYLTRYKSSIGAISLQSQLQTLFSQKNWNLSNVILFTDDQDTSFIKAAKEMFPFQAIINNTSPWDTLALLYSASALIGTNSTLSWWAAKLAYRNRGTIAIMPSQWFKDSSELDAKVSLIDPDFLVYRSIFLD